MRIPFTDPAAGRIAAGLAAWTKPKGTSSADSEVLSLVARHFDLRQPTGISVKPLAITNNSSLFRVSGETLPSDILVKRVNTHDADRQYRSLVEIGESFRDPYFCVPRAIGYDLPEQTIFMEHVDGPDLRRLLLAGDDPKYDKDRSVEMAGQWLRAFHSINVATPSPIDVDKKLRNVRRALDRVRVHYENDPRLNAVIRQFFADAEQLQELPVPTGIIHGDCKPANLLFGAERVAGIDFRDGARGPQVMDVAQFVNNLRLLGIHPLGIRHMRRTENWVRIFLQAYRQPPYDFPEEALRWLRLHHYLRHWSEERLRGSWKGRLQASWLRKQIIALTHQIDRDAH
ncbi:aminoglycoside phosphotransferase family protein [Thiosocius teredinicola]|uniref:aminoglycoside phosphotransferase family protein n=1 Tax=Thiosocius teredinicola TaxID=1973002 RepID=UPI0013DE37EA